jgi:hypothetical protein
MKGKDQYTEMVWFPTILVDSLASLSCRLEKGEMEWNGKVVQTLSDNECEENIWELSELNFHFKLLALHS